MRKREMKRGEEDRKERKREKRGRACGGGERERDIYLIVNKGHPHFHFNTCPLYCLESSRN